MAKRKRVEYYKPPPPGLEGCAPEQCLCYEFIEEAEREGWRVFPEHPDSRFDLFLVAGDGCSTEGVTPGTQIGVQAKMQLNTDLLGQLLKAVRHHHYPGPDYVVGLVPGRPHTDSEGTIAEVMDKLNMGLFYIYQGFVSHTSEYNVKRDNLRTMQYFGAKQPFRKKIKLPEIHYWTEPGVKSPMALTTWKQKAIQFCIDMDRAGGFTSKEFEAARMYVQTWMNAGWVVDSGEKRGRARVYVLNPDTENRPDRKNPGIRTELERLHEEAGKADEVEVEDDE